MDVLRKSEWEFSLVAKSSGSGVRLGFESSLVVGLWMRD